mmetsp:Transcript_4049/g.15618  ORF Transcript_4049/g.15618 Transcript_4049/m.15618 type:complete len:289 (+) Transcript_4049:257-1123(+)
MAVTRRESWKSAAASLRCMGAAARMRSKARSSRAMISSSSSSSPSSPSPSSALALDVDAPTSDRNTSSVRRAATISFRSVTFSSTVRSFAFSGKISPFVASPPHAMNISYANMPTACDKFKLVGPVPPVYFKLLRQILPAPAVGMATAACAQLNSSFVNPVRSFPNSTATFPRFASSRTLSAASLAVISGVPLLGLAVVANTNEHPRSASSASSHRSASANNQSAAHAYRIASSQSGVVRASLPRTSLARSGARPSPSLASSEISRVASPLRVVVVSTNGPTSTSAKS